jgi:hypothetical protein
MTPSISQRSGIQLGRPVDVAFGVDLSHQIMQA